LDSINLSFENDHPSDQTLRAFEVKAKQKLADLADYLQIYTDKSMDESFRDHARQMIMELFISGSVQINLNDSATQKKQNLPIVEFLNMHHNLEQNSLNFIFDSIELYEPLHCVNDLNYKGSLKFSQRVDRSSSTHSLIPVSVMKRVEIIATKIRKQFGSDTLEIWQVCLGDIR
jgi:hypothetical protein